MKQSVTKYQFERAFAEIGRENQFSHEALGAIFDYIEDIDESCDTETELDVIAICCDFSEDTWEAIADDYSIDTHDCADEIEAMETVESYLLDNSWCAQTTTGSFVYQAF